MRFENDTVIITGGAGGIGRGIAERFVTEGANVIIADVQREEARRVAESLAEAAPGNAHAVEADISVPSDVAALVDATVEEFGGLDVLVNNAGVIARASLEDTTTADWQRVLDVNLTGTFLCTREAVSAMDGDGAVVNVASVAGLLGRPGRSAYCASKGGIVNLTRQLSTELAGDGVRVNAVAPGKIMAGLLAERYDADDPDDALTRDVPSGRLGTPSDVAGAVTFLASKDAAYVTGVTLPVDGGWSNGRVQRA